MDDPDIDTPDRPADRPITVRVEPVRREWADALASGDQSFEDRVGIRVEPGWAGFPEAIPAILESARRHDADPWGSHLIFADGILVGLGGFKGAPVDGAVELGYAVAPSWQRRGVATAATIQMVAMAEAAGVRTVVAHTLAEPNASTTVLQRVGFVNVGTVVEHDEGRDVTVWRWELSLDDPKAEDTP